jgi:hypothetical protein
MNILSYLKQAESDMRQAESGILGYPSGNVKKAITGWRCGSSGRASA